jgi:CRP/FNR family transcriptional regulator, cyclic AMP receptor protein
MRATSEQSHVLSQMPMFAGLTPPEREGLLLFMRERKLRPGEVLFNEGAQGDSLFIVLEGELSVTVRMLSPSGASQRELSRSTAGEMIGEMACLDPAPRAATIVARVSTVLAELDRSSLAALEQALPRASSLLVGTIIQLVSTRMREIDQRITSAITGGGSQHPPAQPAPTEPLPEPQARGGWRNLLDRLKGAV